jgi:hypothetical protein
MKLTSFEEIQRLSESFKIKPKDLTITSNRKDELVFKVSKAYAKHIKSDYEKFLVEEGIEDSLQAQHAYIESWCDDISDHTDVVDYFVSYNAKKRELIQLHELGRYYDEEIYNYYKVPDSFLIDLLTKNEAIVIPTELVDLTDPTTAKMYKNMQADDDQDWHRDY